MKKIPKKQGKRRGKSGILFDLPPFGSGGAFYLLIDDLLFAL